MAMQYFQLLQHVQKVQKKLSESMPIKKPKKY